MPIYNRLVGMDVPSCAGAPTISTVTAVDDGAGVCPTGKWSHHATCSLSGTLQPGQEILWEEQIDRSGSWVVFGRTDSSPSPTTLSAFTYGSDGTGASGTFYWQARAYIVPRGAGGTDACSGPTTATEINKTLNLCTV